MAGQLSEWGAQYLANTIGGIIPPSIGTTAPWTTAADEVPGQVWINTTNTPPTLEYWNTTAWVAGPELLYVALLTGDPSTSGTDGGVAQNISDLLEDTTSGYARQQVQFTQSADYPAALTNTALVQFGPYTAAQANPVQWAAIVGASSGDTGHLFYMFTLPVPQQVQVSQYIQIGAGSINWSES